MEEEMIAKVSCECGQLHGTAEVVATKVSGDFAVNLVYQVEGKFIAIGRLLDCQVCEKPATSDGHWESVA